MLYMLLIGRDDKVEVPIPEAEATRMLEGHRRFTEELRAVGKLVAGERLRPESDASRMRMKAGHRQVTDGPFTETKEVLGGFYLIDCATRDEAMEWAAKIPLRDGGHVEVRPIWPI